MYCTVYLCPIMRKGNKRVIHPKHAYETMTLTEFFFVLTGQQNLFISMVLRPA